MKKIIVLAAFLAAGVAHADWYGSTTYDRKDKQESAQVNHVYGLTVGQKFGNNGISAEVRLENEKVEPGSGAVQKQEGLAQIKVSKDFATGTPITPYAALAVGQKNKSTIDFPFWVAEVGAKAKLSDMFTLRYGYRQRTAFENNSVNSYDTTEHTVALSASLTKVDTVGLRYAQERGTSNYNTTGVYYVRSF
jgi:hypothetical protein